MIYIVTLDTGLTYCYSKFLDAEKCVKGGKFYMKCVVRKMLMTIATVAFIFCIGVLADTSTAEAASTFKIRINKQQNCVTIYKLDDKGKYKPYKAMVCSVGNATPIGTFSLKEKIRWHTLDGPVYGQYCTRITGHILFHSVWYYVNGNPATLSNAQYNRLGTVASHGCVRLCVRDARWIYTYCPSGTPVEIYNSKDPGPLGKPDAIKLPEGTGWDPTDDTNPNNPYNKKKPSIKLIKGKKDILYNSKFKLLKTIKVKNTTGFDASDKVTYTIKYKAPGKKYKKVKKINTKKTGLYRVKFKLTDEIGRKASLTVKYKVHRKIMMTSVTLNKSTAYLYLGGSESQTTCRIKLKKCTPSDASIKTLAFSSSDTSVAKVASNGKVTAVAPGTAVIRAAATDGSGIVKECVVHVRKYATGLSITSDKSVINIGETARLTCTLLPAGATGKETLTYTYASSDTRVATVDAQGNVTGAGQGTAVITITAHNATSGGEALTSQVTITVNGPQTDASTSALTVQ